MSEMSKFRFETSFILFSIVIYYHVRIIFCHIQVLYTRVIKIIHRIFLTFNSFSCLRQILTQMVFWLHQILHILNERAGECPGTQGTPPGYAHAFINQNFSISFPIVGYKIAKLKKSTVICVCTVKSYLCKYLYFIKY